MERSVREGRDPAVGLGQWLWLGPLLFAGGVGLYFVARYGGRWAEADSATFAKIIRAFVAGESLVPAFGPTYPNGYAFQAISSYVVTLTGLDVATLQQLVYPLMMPIVVLPAWLVYRELVGSARGATLSTILLFSQPEFLFVILRSSHEKFTRTLMLLGLYLLLRSLKLRDRPWLLATYVALFYVTMFAFIASNNLLAHSFIFASAVALILGRVLETRKAHLRQVGSQVPRRLQYVALSCLVLVYLFTFYAYLPAQHDILVMKSIWDRVAALFLDVQSQPASTYTSAYGAVVGGWVSLPAYFLVSAANWLILAASFVIWTRQGLAWLGQNRVPRSQAAWFLWLFYAAFAAQGTLSAVADASGTMSGNLQHRLFPSFAIFAVAMVGGALDRWRPGRFARPARAALTAAVFCVVVLSVFKATNEPLVSNKWTFYRPTELAALDWTDRHLEDAEIWTDYDERLAVAFDVARGDSANGNRFQGFGILPATRGVLVSEVTRLRSSRLGRPSPVPPDALLVYDNGEAELYHLRPATPFQP